MIRGKVDDLKKKIKEINKDILSYEQEHAELIDEYSFEIKTYEWYLRLLKNFWFSDINSIADRYNWLWSIIPA